MSPCLVINIMIIIKLRWALFVTCTIIQSITISEMCSLHLTHPSAHTLGAVGSRRCGTRGAVGGSVPCSRVSPQSWTITFTFSHLADAFIQSDLQLGVDNGKDNSSRNRDSNPQPRVTSPMLYPLEPRLPLVFPRVPMPILVFSCSCSLRVYLAPAVFP